MARNGVIDPTASVLEALALLQGNVDRERKARANEHLQQFQKSEAAWPASVALLQDAGSPVEAKLFASQTLKGKIMYDLSQLPRSQLPQLKETLLSLIEAFKNGPKIVRTQLCVCLANLALQYPEWHNVVDSVLTAFGSDPQSLKCALEFLKILPEEVTDGKKATLSEDEIRERTSELLEQNSQKVLDILIKYAQHSPNAANDTQLLECITSWLREIPVVAIAGPGSPLLPIIVGALSSETSFEAAVDCMCAIFRETNDAPSDDSLLPVIDTLLPKVLALRSKIAQAAEEEDNEALRNLMRLFCEAAEAWLVLIIRDPQKFKPLVQCILECAANDGEKAAIAISFHFWAELKLYLVLEKYIEARLEFADVLQQLVNVMINHLRYPDPEGSDNNDLFDGDREKEDNFREFRHDMGDVLKDCCEILGTAECLRHPATRIETWLSTYASQITPTIYPHWQELEAALFSLRAMGKMVNRDEAIVLPKLIPVILQLPRHERVSFAAILAIGRFTGWTSAHPEFFQAQFQYIISAFDYRETRGDEVLRAAAQALTFFCEDCSELLVNSFAQLQSFYETVQGRLPQLSRVEVTEGIGSVIYAQPIESVYDAMKLFCDPIVERIKVSADKATDKAGQRELGDQLRVLCAFLEAMKLYVEPPLINPAVKYCETLTPVLSAILTSFVNNSHITEQVCRCYRTMLISYRNNMISLLPSLATQLVTGFESSHDGVFLYVTSSIIREFADEADNDPSLKQGIYECFQRQSIALLRFLAGNPVRSIPDVLEDFFRLAIDAEMYYPDLFLVSELFTHIFDAAIVALDSEVMGTLAPVLHFLRDILDFGKASADTSAEPPPMAVAVQGVIAEKGEILVTKIIGGLTSGFPRDCIPDGSGVLLDALSMLPEPAARWIMKAIHMLPSGSVSPPEMQKLASGLESGLDREDFRKVRTLLQDFTSAYRRRNVNPREGIGKLGSSKFEFAG